MKNNKTIIGYALILSAYTFLCFASQCHGTELVFTSPAAHDTLMAGDSATVTVNAPRFPANSGKFWSLAFVLHPGMANEKIITLVDTVEFSSDTAIAWSQRIKIPLLYPGEIKYALALIYHPSIGIYYSPVFYIIYADVKPVPTHPQAPKMRGDKLGFDFKRFTLTGREISYATDR